MPNVNTLLDEHVVLKYEFPDRFFLNGYLSEASTGVMRDSLANVGALVAGRCGSTSPEAGAVTTRWASPSSWSPQGARGLATR